MYQKIKHILWDHINIFRIISIFLAILVALFLVISQFFLNSFIPLNTIELSTIRWNNLFFYIVILVFLCLFILMISILKRTSPFTLFIFCSSIFLILGFYLIFTSSTQIRADALHVLTGAHSINNGETVLFEADQYNLSLKGYLFRYPHQLGLVTYERLVIWTMKSNNTRIFFVLNLLVTILSNLFIWLISKEIYQNIIVEKISILLTFLFLPQLFYIFFIYGTVIGMFFGIAGLYCLIKYFKNTSSFRAVGAIILLSLSYFVRNNYIILLISIFFFTLLFYRKCVNKQILCVLVLIIICAKSLSAANLFYYESFANEKLSGEPKIAWIAMGTDLSENQKNNPGWYNRYVERVYLESKGNPELIKRKSKEQIGKNINYIYKNPLSAGKNFFRKIITSWNDGSLQSIWSGRTYKIFNQNNSGYISQKIFSNGKVYLFIHNYNNVVLFIIYLGFLFGTIVSNKKEIYIFGNIFIFYLVGGFFFHLFWEAKSQYIFPYIVFSIPVSSVGLYYFYKQINNILYVFLKLKR
uniref:hypothetical protein n=1 Tax=Streptococcus pluranimalium TaxID=82348 RepID=UPI003F68C443